MELNIYHTEKASKFIRMKKIFLSISILLTVMVIKAQTITLEAGYFNSNRDGVFLNKTYFDAVKLGATYTYDWKYNLGFQSGLLLNTGYSHNVQKFSTKGDSVIFRTWNVGLEIPVRAVYHVKLFRNVRLFGYAGPNIQIGLFQPQRIDANLSAVLAEMTGIQSGRFDLYTSDLQPNGINRINLQLGTGGGIQWKNYLLKSGYDWGLNNLDRTKKDRITQGQWHLTFGYQF